MNHMLQLEKLFQLCSSRGWDMWRGWHVKYDFLSHEPQHLDSVSGHIEFTEDVQVLVFDAWFEGLKV